MTWLPGYFSRESSRYSIPVDSAESRILRISADYAESILLCSYSDLLPFKFRETITFGDSDQILSFLIQEHVSPLVIFNFKSFVRIVFDCSSLDLMCIKDYWKIFGLIMVILSYKYIGYLL